MLSATWPKQYTRSAAGRNSTESVSFRIAAGCPVHRIDERERRKREPLQRFLVPVRILTNPIRAKMSRAIATISCPHCGGTRSVKAGRRKLKSGDVRQLYRCEDCCRRFSYLNRSGKHTSPKIILRALTLVCGGYSYDEIREVLRREFNHAPAKSALSRWNRDFPLPWLAIRDRMLVSGERVVSSHWFTHANLSYLYAWHLPKSRFLKRFPGLFDYLRKLPNSLNHALFDNAAHCDVRQYWA